MDWAPDDIDIDYGPILLELRSQGNSNCIGIGESIFLLSQILRNIMLSMEGYMLSISTSTIGDECNFVDGSYDTKNPEWSQ